MEKSKTNRSRLIVFDVEGVIIPKNRFLFEIGRNLGFLKLVKILIMGLLYETDLLSVSAALKAIFKTLRGIEQDTLLGVLDRLPLMPGVHEVFNNLNRENYKTVLISSGLPTFVVQRLADLVGANYALGFEVGLDNKVLTGEIWGDVIDSGGKAKVLAQILKDEKLKDEYVVVADDRNNASIFTKNALKIGYNPDFILRFRADTVVTGRLSGILPVITGAPIERSFPSKKEIYRELIHASGFFVPIIASVIGIPMMSLAILGTIALYVLSEWMRMGGRSMPIVSKITMNTASNSELGEFVTAPILFGVGILLALVLFPAPASSAAIAIFALGDSAASIFGKIPYLKTSRSSDGKSLEGSIAGFIFASLGAMFFINPLGAMLGAAIAMIIEYLPLPFNDNLTIPIFTGLALTLLL